jgi:putative ABC transport system ATP-binding protein
MSEEPSLEPLLSLERVLFTWPGDSQSTLDVESLKLAQGQRMLIHGPSGCGKSTLLSLIVGVINPQQGSLSFLGKDYSSASGSVRDQLRADHMGYVFQQFNLLPFLSVVGNVELACQFSALRRNKAVARSGSVKHEALRLLDALQIPDKLLGQAVSQLSIGQQQRVAVARALIGSPELVIADEPTSALDSRNRDRFIELMIHELDYSGSSLLLVSHDEGLAQYFPNVLDLPTINRGGHAAGDLTEEGTNGLA